MRKGPDRTPLSRKCCPSFQSCKKFFTLLNAPNGSNFTYVAEWFTVGNI